SRAAARIHCAKHELGQRISAQAGHRVIGKTSAKSQVVSPACVVPVIVSPEHEPCAQGVVTDYLSHIILERIRVDALEPVLPLLWTYAIEATHADSRHGSKPIENKVKAANRLLNTRVIY